MWVMGCFGSGMRLFSDLLVRPFQTDPNQRGRKPRKVLAGYQRRQLYRVTRQPELSGGAQDLLVRIWVNLIAGGLPLPQENIGSCVGAALNGLMRVSQV